MRLIKQAALSLSVICLLPIVAASAAAPSGFRQLSPDDFHSVQVPVAVEHREGVIPEATDIPIIIERPSLPSPHPMAIERGSRAAVAKVESSPKPAAPRSVVLPRTGRSMRGIATWYCKAGVSICMAVHPDRYHVPDYYAAAGPALRSALGSHWRNKTVHVCGRSGCVNVVLADWCACGGGHTIDLYWDAFDAVSPGSGGESVTISW